MSKRKKIPHSQRVSLMQARDGLLSFMTGKEAGYRNIHPDASLRPYKGRKLSPDRMENYLRAWVLSEINNVLAWDEGEKS